MTSAWLCTFLILILTYLILGERKRLLGWGLMLAIACLIATGLVEVLFETNRELAPAFDKGGPVCRVFVVDSGRMKTRDYAALTALTVDVMAKESITESLARSYDVGVLRTSDLAGPKDYQYIEMLLRQQVSVMICVDKPPTERLERYLREEQEIVIGKSRVGQVSGHGGRGGAGSCGKVELGAAIPVSSWDDDRIQSRVMTLSEPYNMSCKEENWRTLVRCDSSTYFDRDSSKMRGENEGIAAGMVLVAQRSGMGGTSMVVMGSVFPVYDGEGIDINKDLLVRLLMMMKPTSDVEVTWEAARFGDGVGFGGRIESTIVARNRGGAPVRAAKIAAVLPREFVIMDGDKSRGVMGAGQEYCFLRMDGIAVGDSLRRSVSMKRRFSWRYTKLVSDVYIERGLLGWRTGVRPSQSEGVAVPCRPLVVRVDVPWN